MQCVRGEVGETIGGVVFIGVGRSKYFFCIVQMIEIELQGIKRGKRLRKRACRDGVRYNN
jgi:hypothetical protein